jgi:hypothetical protein
MDIRAAIEAPRVGHEHSALQFFLTALQVYDQLFPQNTIVETTYSQQAIDGLRQRGHNVTS